ncbi:putative arsenical pump-driving ATPase 2 [Propionigenium maris DSM 9537]|uniref:Arsenical pump-driving ATPase 2 n=1 Tax=Propionigenium maris DSM 9537 TaxID=1123000 RepID=A0A9W6GK06_9FUSO|nr:ArsA family ATPase [Propionigenium maris]GLI55241.1 putative arsenical pump-driving ATPase 2 [Propionigenium maris DSM 9537]
MRKIVFFGGKGGVGKTTCASAYAIGRAEEGKKVLLISTDPAHSTRDIFSCKEGRGECIRVEEGLDLLEIDAHYESHKYLEGVMDNCKKIVSPVILDEIKKQIRAASISPGTHEAALFERMGEIILNSPEYDYLIFDTAPTGHTLRLIKLPELLEGWTETLIRKRRKILRLKEMKTLQRNLVESDKVLKILSERKRKFGALGKILRDREVCIFNFVLNPEIMALKETQRALTELEEAGIKTENLIVNKCLPSELDKTFWEKKLMEQEKVISTLETENSHIRSSKFYIRPSLSPRECAQNISQELKVSID